MHRRLEAAVPATILMMMFALAQGCGSVPALPTSFDVATSATDRLAADAGTGPAGLAGSTWSLVRQADPSAGDTGAEDPPTPSGPYGGLLNGRGLDRPPVGERIFLVRFGSEGELAEITENRFFLAQFYGSEIPVGGEWTGTTLPGVAFRSDSYGVQVGDRFGVAVVVNVRFGNLFVGQAVLYAWGTIADTVIDGTFGYVLDFTDGIVNFLNTVADQYPVEGLRVEP